MPPNTHPVFLIAAAALFPELVLGVFWKRANANGATLGMASGLLITYYMVRNEAWMRDVFRISVPVDLWFGIQPIAAGVFGVLVGFAVIVAVSRLSCSGWRAQRRLPGPHPSPPGQLKSFPIQV